MTTSEISLCSFRSAALMLLLGTIAQCAFATDKIIKSTQVTPTVVVFSTSAGNVVASVGPDGALLVGTPSGSSTPKISEILASRTKSSFRYVVVWPQPVARSEGDAGWLQRGAFVAIHENVLRRLGAGAMGAPKPAPARFAEIHVERPPIAFSEVLAFDLNGDAIHIVHQKPGYSDADAIAHFHVANLVYLGEVFPGDGYPEVDASQGGSLDGFLTTLEAWAYAGIQVLPARGDLTDGKDVKAFRDMITTVRQRVETMRKEGKTEAQVVAAHVTADFDTRWGHGRVKPEDFVREVYACLNQKH